MKIFVRLFVLKLTQICIGREQNRPSEASLSPLATCELGSLPRPSEH